MKRLLILAFSVFSLLAVADSKHEIKLGDDWLLHYGADVRARWELFDRTVPSPDLDTATHPANQYLRVRTRAWAELELPNTLRLNLRLVNRVHYVTSSPSNPNNRDSATWEFPDEVALDTASLTYTFADGITLTAGRQNLMFGNGLIFSDATPFDQGRGNYNDGLTFNMFEKDLYDLSVFVLYDKWKDHSVFINDRNRRLRSADILTVGGYLTIHCTDWLSLDLYKMFQYIDDTHPREAERNFNPDVSAKLFTDGFLARITPKGRFSGSLEGAIQTGEDYDDNTVLGFMTDARFDTKLDDILPGAPVAGLEYTFFSGDKEQSDRYEGWTPVFSQAPLWGDELVPIMIDGNWTNLHAFRSSLTFKPLTDSKLILAATQYMTDRISGPLCTGEGHNFGLLLSTSVSYKLNENISFLFQLSHFNPGNTFANGHNSLWGRFEVTLTF